LGQWLHIGWRETLVMAILWLLVLSASYHAASAQAAMIIMRSPDEGYDVVGAILCATAAAAISCLAIFWFWPISSEEYPDIRKTPGSASRRRFLLLILAGAAAVSGATVRTGYAWLPSRPARPRFRRVKRWVQTTWPSGFYLNPKSQVLHYVDVRGRARGLTNRGKAQLVRYHLAAGNGTGDTPAVRAAIFSPAYEAEAQRMLKANEPRQAMELLFRALAQDAALADAGRQPSVRLYDFLAVVIVHFGNDDDMNRLQKIVPHRYRESVFSDRMIKWSSPDSAWYRRWKRTGEVRWG
jgi:hypothetical protein